MTRNKLKAFTAAAAVCLCLSAPICASAATPEEAAEIARQYGYSEDMIQQGWNEYNANPELYPPEVIDAYIEELKKSGQMIVTEVPYDPDATVPAAATTVQNTQTTAVSDTKTSTEPVKTDGITLTMPDGSTFTRISKEAFIALSYDDKQAYLATFTPEQQRVFIENLSPEEYKSMMKQLPTDKKMEVIDELTKVTDDMGLTLTVDEVTDDNVIISMKNKDGELVAVGQARDVVENTGYDRRGILFVCAALVGISLAAAVIVSVKSFCLKDIEVKHEQ